MKTNELSIEGDTPGSQWRVPIFRFEGASRHAPSVYLQAGLHANERPGPAVLHVLLQDLMEADARGEILGDIIVIPQANPIGMAQAHFGTMQGRFDLGTRTNFNRDFPLVTLGERDSLLTNLQSYDAVDRLKRALLSNALTADIVLDLHCDDESVQYAYIDEAFWPEASDLAAALDMAVVLLADGASTAFEEAVGHAFKHADDGRTRFSTTLELRGLRDVSAALARRDAAGLFAFLVARGVVAGAPREAHVFNGSALPLDNVEMIRTPESGTILFHKDIGDQVVAGDVLATIIVRPGESGGTIDLTAPQDGLIVTRTSQRFARRRENLMKIACAARSGASRRPGTLED